MKNQTIVKDWMFETNNLSKKLGVPVDHVLLMLEHLGELNKINHAKNKQSQPEKTNVDLMLETADMLFESCTFEGVDIEWFASWDISDEKDFVRVVGFTDSEDKSEGQSSLGSVHVEFDENGDWVSIYMLEVSRGQMINTTLPKSLTDAQLTEKTIDAIKDSLSNDFTSTDEELTEHFLNNFSLSQRQASAWIALRTEFLRGRFIDRDEPTPTKIYATLKKVAA